jgi:hypothetical protein
LVSNFSAFLDVSRNLVQIGEADVASYQNRTLPGFLNFRNQRNKNEDDDGSWAVRIEDVMYGSPINGTSLDDLNSDLAIVDTMFPGIMIPNRVWDNLQKVFVKNITATGNTTVNCSITENILGEEYSVCYSDRRCGTKKWLSDFYLYFNATTSDDDKNKTFTQYILTLKKENYAVDIPITFFNTTTNTTETKEMCKFLVYGQNNSMEKRYIIGNAFLRSYYVMLNYTSDSLGFNGDYSEV